VSLVACLLPSFTPPYLFLFLCRVDVCMYDADDTVPLYPGVNDLVIVAAGSGITPFVRILYSWIREKKRINEPYVSMSLQLTYTINTLKQIKSKLPHPLTF